MRVLLHDGGKAFYARSGIGQAVRQQAQALEHLGTTRVDSLADRPDIVQLNFATPGSALLARRARRRGIPVVHFAHSTLEDSRGSIHFSDQLAPLYWRFLRACYAGGDVLVTPSEYSRRLLRRGGVRAPIEVLSNGVDTTLFSPDDAAGTTRRAFRESHGIAPDATLVVSVGHWFRRKGIVDLVEVARACPEVQVWWFGYTDPRVVQGDVRAALASAPPNFRAAGYVGREELRDAYRAADLFALSSREETEGIVVLEALACATPTVVRDIPVFDPWLVAGRDCHMVADVPGLIDVVRRAAAGTLEDRTAAGRRVALDRDLSRIAEEMPRIWEAAREAAVRRARRGTRER